MSDELENVKVGDSLRISDCYGRFRKDVAIRLTKSQVLVTGDIRFRKSSGRKVGDSWHDADWASVWTDKDSAEQEKVELDNDCKYMLHELDKVRNKIEWTEELRDCLKVLTGAIAKLED